MSNALQNYRVPGAQDQDHATPVALPDPNAIVLATQRHGPGMRPKRIGGGMGQALNAAAAMPAYTLSDRGTWLSFRSKGKLVIVVEGDPHLINRYDVIELDPGKHAAAELEAAHRLAAFLVSPEGQVAIGEFRVDGEQLFHPSAAAPR